MTQQSTHRLDGWGLYLSSPRRAPVHPVHLFQAPRPLGRVHRLVHHHHHLLAHLDPQAPHPPALPLVPRSHRVHRDPLVLSLTPQAPPALGLLLLLAYLFQNQHPLRPAHCRVHLLQAPGVPSVLALQVQDRVLLVVEVHPVLPVQEAHHRVRLAPRVLLAEVLLRVLPVLRRPALPLEALVHLLVQAPHLVRHQVHPVSLVPPAQDPALRRAQVLGVHRHHQVHRDRAVPRPALQDPVLVPHGVHTLEVHPVPALHHRQRVPVPPLKVHLVLLALVEVLVVHLVLVVLLVHRVRHQVPVQHH